MYTSIGLLFIIAALYHELYSEMRVDPGRSGQAVRCREVAFDVYCYGFVFLPIVFLLLHSF